MKDEQRWMLAILREANRKQVMLTEEFYAVLKAVFPLSDAEINEIAEILKADLREKLAQHKHFGEINAWLSRTGPLNPYGDKPPPIEQS